MQKEAVMDYVMFLYYALQP